jgi:hypothetical protein
VRNVGCSSIGKNKVPQPRTDTNDIVFKVFYAVSEGMHQNIGALPAANGMLDKDADLTQGCIGGLLLITQLRVGVLLTLARLLRRDVNPIAAVVRWNTKIASIDPNIAICKPIQIRW